MMQDVSPFGAWLKQRRRTLDLTQGDLAHLVGCSTDTIYRLEAGTRRPSKQVAQRLLAVLEIPADRANTFLHLARQSVLSDAPPPDTGETKSTPARRAIAARPPAQLPLPSGPLIGRR